MRPKNSNTVAVQQSKTQTVHLVRPPDCNHYGNLYGGTTMAWMDGVAFVAATRYTCSKVVTVHTDAIDFHHPVPQGCIVELAAWITSVGRSSLQLEVELWVELMEKKHGRTLACQAGFVMVALGENGRPKALNHPSL